MADTNLNNFVNGVASYLASSIFPSIVHGLASRGVTTSVDDLLAMTNTPSVRPQPAIPAPAVPAMPFGGGAVPSMAPTVSPASRKNTATAAPVVGHTCAYQFKRGEKKNLYCGKPTAPGSEYCNTCLKSRKNLPKEAGGAVPGAAPAVPGMSGLPSGYSAPVPNAQPADNSQLSVVEYDVDRNLYREPINNFIVTPDGNGITVVGRLDEVKNQIVALTAQEQVVAQSIGLSLAAGTPPVAAGPAPVAQPAIPTAQVPQAVAPQVPAIPSVPVPQVPVAQVPAIPAIPTGPAPQVPAIPTITQLNQPAAPAGYPAAAVPIIPQAR